MLRAKGASTRNIEFPRFGNSYARKIHFTFLVCSPVERKNSQLERRTILAKLGKKF